METKNNEGATALYNAAFFCHPEIVKLLLEKGADLDARNKNGVSAFEVMSAEWSPTLEEIYRGILGALRIPADVDRIKRTRPAVAKILREFAAKRVGKRSASVPMRRDAAMVAAEDWPTYNYDAAGWRCNATEKTLSPANVGQLTELWRFPPVDAKETIGVVHATPAVVAGEVYFGATFPAFYKLASDGKLLWVYRNPARKTVLPPSDGGPIPRNSAPRPRRAASSPRLSSRTGPSISRTPAAGCIASMRRPEPSVGKWTVAPRRSRARIGSTCFSPRRSWPMAK